MTSDIASQLEKASSQSSQTTDGEQETQPNMFIGEGKKYATTEEADKAIAFSQDHIKKIEDENAALRESALKAKTFDDVLESIKNQSSVLDTNSETSEGNHQQVDIDALVEKAVTEKLSASESRRTAQTNSEEVVSALAAKFGASASEVYAKKAEDLGVDLDTLSMTSPKAVIELFKESSSSVGNQSGTVNTQTIGKGQTQAGTYQYWQDQISSGKITRDEGYKRQHESLSEMGPEKFYQTR